MKKTALYILIFTLAACNNVSKNTAVGEKAVSDVQVPVVEVLELKQRPFEIQLLSNGKLRAEKKASLGFPFSGRIAEIKVKNGDYVAKGAVLATLDRPDLKIALETAQAALDRDRLSLYDILAGQGYQIGDTLSPPKEILNVAKIKSGYSSDLIALRKARLDFSQTVLTAPFSGKVSGINQNSFDRSSGDTFCTIVDDRHLYAEFSVMESEFAFLQKGLSVTVSPFFDKNRRSKAEIVSVSPSIDEKGRIGVRALLSNDGGLLDGMNVRIVAEKAVGNYLVVPRSAVVIRDDMEVVFTYTPDGTAHWKYVNILHSNGDSYAIEADSDRNSTLEEGENVIISGNLNLADGSRVRME